VRLIDVRYWQTGGASACTIAPSAAPRAVTFSGGGGAIVQQ
jgi:hypothetical protein